MNYTEAVVAVTDGKTITTVLVYLIAIAVLLILTAKAIEAGKTLFGKNKGIQTLEQHCAEADARFLKDERHISDLKEGQRVNCIALMAVLNHALHDGNNAEMESALKELQAYLINRR